MDEDMLARMNNAQRRDRVLEDFNRSTLDDVGLLIVFSSILLNVEPKADQD